MAEPDPQARSAKTQRPDVIVSLAREAALARANPMPGKQAYKIFDAATTTCSSSGAAPVRVDCGWRTSW
jgi:hypothetical protein